MNFNYKLFGGKHVPDISLYIVRTVDKSNHVIDEYMLDVAPLSRIARSHIHKTLIHEVNVLQEIIATSTTRKYVCEGLIKMLIYQAVSVFSSTFTVLDVEKDIVLMD